MKRSGMLFAAAALVVVVVAGWALWNRVLGPTLAPSGPLTAVPLGLASATPAAGQPADDPPTAASATEAQPSAAPATPTSQRLLLEIDPDESEARFTLSEDLRGQPNTVVGITNQVAGQIAIDPADLSATQVGVIQVNARALATDSDRRNQAIRNFILNTDQFELITFTPTAIQGLSGSGAPGQAFSFQIAGDLTIRDVTAPVVFDVTATADSGARVSGTARATVQRSDFGLTIPQVPSVANVSEAVQLELDFVATAAGG